MSSQIDEEVLTEILKRLPVKLLMQFRCVSKSWYYLISNPSFISTHTRYTLENHKTTKLLLRHYDWAQKEEKYTMHLDEKDEKKPFLDYHELVFRFKSYSQYFEIVGSCNGLLCLSDTYRINSHTIILWNPTIGKSVTLPMPNINLDLTYMFVLGFGFDSKFNDYKVVRIVYGVGDHGCKVVISPKVEVYELRMDSWRSISVIAAPQYVISELSLQVFLNGSVHWIGYNPSEADGDFRDLSLVLFDMDDEQFREMKLPDSVAGLSVLDISIVVSGQFLSLAQYNRHTHSQWIQYDSCCIWVMTEYGVMESWAKQITIDLQGGVGKALGLRTNYEILLVGSNGELLCYNVQTQEINHLGIKGIARSFYLAPYIETLALLKGPNGTLGQAIQKNSEEKQI